VLAPRGALGEPLAFAVLALLGGAASLHRPLGGSGLGTGTAAVPLALALAGVAPAGWVAAAAGVLGELGRGRLAQRQPEPLPERRNPLRRLEGAAGTALAALAAGGLLATLPGGATSLPALAAAGAAFLVVAGGLELGIAGARGKRLRPRLVAPLVLDAAGWAAGTALVRVAAALDATLALLLLAALALLAAEAARNARLHGLSQRNADDLRRLSGAGERIVAGGQPLGGVAEQLRVECANILPFQWFQFELPAADGRSASWWAGPGGELSEGEPAPPAGPPALPGIHRRSPWEVVERELRIDGQAIARLRLWCDPRRIEPAARRLLDDLLPQMAGSVHRALLDRAARHDALTGVASRRVLEGRLQAAYRAACEEGAALAVALFDLDHFKRINDTLGHAAGDQALIAVARYLDGERRERDLLCRYGGEEFTLLLEGTDGGTALATAERLRQGVAALDFRFEGRPVPLTLSAGVAAFPELHVKTAVELLLLADGALYEAKRRGRDRCLLDSGSGYRDAQGRRVAAAPRKPTEPPKFFA
jgi:diguanylate cyclase (GGDEF)-like protein